VVQKTSGKQIPCDLMPEQSLEPQRHGDSEKAFLLPVFYERPIAVPSAVQSSSCSDQRSWKSEHEHEHRSTEHEEEVLTTEKQRH